jgi:hypothetical protein
MRMKDKFEAIVDSSRWGDNHHAAGEGPAASGTAALRGDARQNEKIEPAPWRDAVPSTGAVGMGYSHK